MFSTFLFSDSVRKLLLLSKQDLTVETPRIRTRKTEKGRKQEKRQTISKNQRLKMDSSTSPLCSPREEKFHSPPESPSERKPEKSSPKALVPVDRYGCAPSPHRSPREEKKPVPIPEEKQNNVPVKPPSPVKHPSSVKPPSPILVMNRSIREELSGVTKVDRGGGEGFAVAGGLEDGGDRRSRATLSIPRRTRREAMVKRAALGLRVCEVVFCLISFSVMAADKTQGWSGDSFDRYKEYRYCISVTIIGFVYGGFQAYDLAYHLITGKHLIRHHLRYYFDFSLDQILAYLLISASSSAATRVDDWQSNWGKDPFTEMASASIGMSFLAFFAFAVSSLISGYNLCSRNWT